MTWGIILAAGKGKRFGATQTNKTVVQLLGKPLVKYGVELLLRKCGKVVVVTGAMGESVEEVVAPMGVRVVRDGEVKGTGWSLKKAIEEMELAIKDMVVVGLGDHMMFYHDETVEKLIDLVHKRSQISMVVATHEDPNKLAWGRVVRNEQGEVLKIVEHKDANEEERKVQDLNAGLYAFAGDFLKSAVKELKPSTVTGEYYMTDLIAIAVQGRLKVSAVVVPFDEVGYGINTVEELQQAEKLLKSR